MREIYNNIFLNSRKTILLSGLFLIVLFFVFTILPLGKLALSSESNNEEINVEENEKKIDQLKEEIRQVQSEVDKQVLEIKAKQKETRTLKSEVSIYENRIYKNELEVKETKLTTEEAELEIEKTEKKINESEIRIEKDRILLKDFIQLLYSYEQEDSMLEILITRKNIADFFNEVDAVESVKDEIFETIVNLRNEKKEAELQNEELEEQNEERHELIQIRIDQNNSLDDLKKQKNELLEITKGEEKKFQRLLEENKNILPSLRAQLHDLQSLGQKIEFTDALSASEYASSVTGVRQEFILAIFQVETRWGALKGTGNWEDDLYRCYLRLSKIYPSREAYYIKRAEIEKNAFFSIVNRLNLDPMSVTVSKEPTYGCGGAMGFAQFLPSTWVAYEGRVSAITGSYPPNPWNLADALVTMAVKVSDIKGVTSGDPNAEYEAAGRYIGGGAWRKKTAAIKYADRVMLFTDLYSKDLN
ncbi:lytic murein transglycosylase [Candidatus Parcubacteria bacterium]|nr:lytic murein transglycosylase [Candidatus Parcubacteria bacterium]